jgi:hypothetical protein
MGSPSGGEARRRGGAHAGKAPPWPEMTISSLTRGQVFGEDLNRDEQIIPRLCRRAARPSGGLFRFWAVILRISRQLEHSAPGQARSQFMFNSMKLAPAS